jgi:protein-tyrosine phosphatase
MDNFLEKVQNKNIMHICFPIVDGSIPDEEEEINYRKMVSKVVEMLRTGETVIIHCRGGLGRTGTLAACCLLSLSDEFVKDGNPIDVDKAIKHVRKARKGAIENARQINFVHKFGQMLKEDIG